LLPQESRLAQSFTLKSPTRLQLVRLELREPKGQCPGLFCDLRIYRTNADGSPSQEMADPNARAWLGSRPGRPNFFPWYFRKSFVLPAGRYAMVLSKPPALPEERHHFAFGLWEEDRLPGETAFVWESNAPGWRKADGVLSFSVFGFER